MLKFVSLIGALLTFLSISASAAEVEVQKIRVAGGSSSAQVYLSFDELPPYTMSRKGKRVDIILDARLANTEPLQFDTDERIVKFLTQDKEEQSIITFFLRYEPQELEVTRARKNTLVVDILLGNQFTKTYPELSSKLEGLAIVEQENEDYTNPYISSPYSNNWLSFFARYEPDIVTTAPLRYTVPPFPVVDLLPDVISSDILSADVFTLSVQEKWKEMLPVLLDLINASREEEARKQLALTFGETLMRAKDFQNGYKQLYVLQEKYQKGYVGIASAYLLALLRAVHEDPFVADYQLRELENDVEEDFALSPFIVLSQIEMALMTNRLERASALLLKDNIAFSPKLAHLKDMRQADYWFASGSLIKAYVGYQLLEDKQMLENHPYSLNGYCNAFYHQKKYAQASQCFDKLSSLVEKKEHLSMISLKKAMADLHFKSAREMYVDFSRIEDTFPNTEAGHRASLKKTDIRYLSQPSWRQTSVEYYRALAENATDRNIAEEAALKEAIVYSELGDKEKSIDLLLDFLRDFGAGNLTNTAQALLIEILPGQLEKLLSAGQYVDAIVLAKKNRDFFQNKWIDIELLGLLAKAYHELGIFSEAQNLYLFLLRTAGSQEDEKYYLPLLSILYAQRDYDLVEEISTQFTYNYPSGKDREEVNLLLLQSLMASGKNDKALDLVLSRALPDTLQAREIAATLYFTSSRYEKVIDTLEPLSQSASGRSEDSLFILGESYFQMDQYMQAEPLFRKVMENEKFSEQARYRVATIKKNAGDTESSLNLFKEIVEKGSDPLWIKLAQRELDFYQLNQQL